MSGAETWQEGVAKLRSEAGELLDKAQVLSQEAAALEKRCGDWAPEIDKLKAEIGRLTLDARRKLRFATGVEAIELPRQTGTE